MRVLNVEDNVFKHNDICKVLKQSGKVEIVWVRNLEEALGEIEKSYGEHTPYDLVITDMWYPEHGGGEDSQSGGKFIQTIQDRGWKLPVILISTVRYSIPEILGTIHYSENEEWESRLLGLVKALQ